MENCQLSVIKFHIMAFKISSFLAIFLIISIFKNALADKVCNDFIDTVLNDIKADKEYFEEPYKIPENQKSFGIYELEHGHIFGLSTLHRNGDVTALKTGKNPYLKVHLGAGEILVKANIKRKFLALGKSANVDVTIPYAEMTFSVVPKQDGTESTIKDFKIDEVKGLTVKVSGAGLVKDFLLNAFIKGAGRFAQTAVKNAIEDKLKRFLKNKVLDYTIPEDCFRNSWE